MNYSENVQLVLSCGVAVSAIILSMSLPIWIITRSGFKDWFSIVKDFKRWASGQMGIEK